MKMPHQISLEEFKDYEVTHLLANSTTPGKRLQIVMKEQDGNIGSFFRVGVWFSDPQGIDSGYQVTKETTVLRQAIDAYNELP